MTRQVGTVMSMTGFARHEGGSDAATWCWEIKSVNGRGLDVRCRVPQGAERFEQKLRTELAKRFKRGNFNVTLTLRQADLTAAYRLNRELLSQIVDLATGLQAEIAASPPRIDGLLAIRGVLEPVDAEPSPEALEARDTAMEQGLLAGLADLAAMREVEGARLAEVVSDMLGHIGGLVESARAASGSQPEFLRARLQTLMRELLPEAPALPEDRLVQELALIVSKADIREELDRLQAHTAAVRGLLESGGAIGRKLDFLCQELNREANTLCSKSSDIELTRIGLDLKSAIEQLREQVQNIE